MSAPADGGSGGSGGSGGTGIGDIGKGWALFLLALAVLCIVLAVIVSIVSDATWSKVTTFILAIITIIFGGGGTRALQVAARREGYRAATLQR